MPNFAHQNDVQVDRVHADAICEEIGERLSVALGPQRHELPPRLLELMDNLRRLDWRHERFFKCVVPTRNHPSHDDGNE